MGKKKFKPTLFDTIDIPCEKFGDTPISGVFEVEFHKTAKILRVVEPPANKPVILCSRVAADGKFVKHRFGVYVASSVIELPGDYVGSVFRLDRTSYVAYHVVYHGVVDD